jgi:hypothetical protein
MNAETSPATHIHRPQRTGGMALRLLAVVALTLTLTISPALAKKKKKKKKKKAVASSQIKKTQIESFDAVFTKAKLMDNKVISAERRVAKSKKALQTALKLSKKQTYKDCIRELKKYKKHVKMVQKGKVPRLTIKSTAPKKMKKDLKKAIKSINTLMDNMPAAVVDLKDAAKASVELSKEAKKFPNELKAELSQMGDGGLWAMVTTLPKTGRIIMKNLKIMGTIPGRSANTTKELADISSTIVKTFK